MTPPPRYEPLLLAAAILVVLCALAHAVASGQELAAPTTTTHTAVRRYSPGVWWWGPPYSTKAAQRLESANPLKTVTKRRRGAAVTISRALVAEAGLGCQRSECDYDVAREHAAIAHALGRGAKRRGVRLTKHTRDYCAAFRVDSTRTRWIMELDSSGARPQSFPGHLLWHTCRGKRCTPRRQLWLETIERAERYLAGELGDPCGADHWGSKTHSRDVRRGRRAVREGRWRMARCSKQMRNAYYVKVGQ